jgi:hypothetical protein
MIVSELLQELANRSQNAQVLVIEGGSPIMIESVVKPEQESQTVVFLMGDAVKWPMIPRASRFLSEALARVSCQNGDRLPQQRRQAGTDELNAD